MADGELMERTNMTNVSEFNEEGEIEMQESEIFQNFYEFWMWNINHLQLNCRAIIVYDFQDELFVEQETGSNENGFMT